MTYKLFPFAAVLVLAACGESTGSTTLASPPPIYLGAVTVKPEYVTVSREHPATLDVSQTGYDGTFAVRDLESCALPEHRRPTVATVWRVNAHGAGTLRLTTDYGSAVRPTGAAPTPTPPPPNYYCAIRTVDTVGRGESDWIQISIQGG